MSQLFQINEQDLETLERATPAIASALPPEALDRKDIREHLEMVKKVLSDVRWDYGPHSDVEIVD